MVKKGTTKSSTKGNSEGNPAVDESERLNRLLKPSTWSRQLEGEPLLPEDGLGARVKTKRTAMGLTHDGLSELTKIADGERTLSCLLCLAMWSAPASCPMPTTGVSSMPA